jgi:hypothetical protein
MIHPAPSSPSPVPAITITVNTAYYDQQQQNVIVNLKGIKGTVFVNACNGRAFHFAITRMPGQAYAAETLTCKGDKVGKPFFVQ